MLLVLTSKYAICFACSALQWVSAENTVASLSETYFCLQLFQHLACAFGYTAYFCNDCNQRAEHTASVNMSVFDDAGRDDDDGDVGKMCNAKPSFTMRP